MKTWQKHIVNYNLISRLLLVAMLSFTIFPISYHLHDENHHADSQELSSHPHTVDFHTALDAVDLEHFDNGLHQVQMGTPDSVIKKPNPLFFTMVFLVAVFCLIPYANYRVERRTDYRQIGRLQNPYFLSPPLRAPPLF